MGTVTVTCKITQDDDDALRLVAAKRRAFKSDVIREAIKTYLAITNGNAEIAAILTDFRDGRETFDGTVSRLAARERITALGMLEGMVQDE
jgi:hypothetical protein